MPTIQLPDGKKHEVPNHGTFTVDTMHMSTRINPDGDGHQDITIRNVYDFNMDSGFVKHSTWAQGTDGTNPKKTGGGSARVSDFLVAVDEELQLPLTVNLEGHRHQIPEGPHRVNVMARDPVENRMWRRTEYSFCLPSQTVQVKVYSVPSPTYVAGVVEDTTAPLDEELIDDYQRHISGFATHDNSALDPRVLKNPWGAHNFDPSYMKGRKDPHQELEKAAYASTPASRAEYDHLRNRGIVGSMDEYKHLKYKARGTQRLEKIHRPLKKTPKKGMVPMHTGTRVKVGKPFEPKHSEKSRTSSNWLLGTVVEAKCGVEEGYTLLCMDEPDDRYTDYPDTCGVSHGRIFPTQALRKIRSAEGLSSKNSKADHRGIPKHVGVFTPKSFSYDGVKFPVGAVGRMISKSGDIATVAWLSKLKDPQGQIWSGNDGQESYKQVFNVPMDYLRWCCFTPKSLKVRVAWHSTKSPFEVGAILVYNSPKALRLDHQHVVTKGVILKHEGWGGDRRSLQTRILSGVSPDLIGFTCSVRKQDVIPLEGSFIAGGTNVEVVAEIMFRRKNLQGKQGVVILPTDIDGDVGVEFPEDIEAGSLDGYGTDGRCLYIPSESVKEVSK